MSRRGLHDEVPLLYGEGDNRAESGDTCVWLQAFSTGRHVLLNGLSATRSRRRVSAPGHGGARTRPARLEPFHVSRTAKVRVSAGLVRGVRERARAGLRAGIPLAVGQHCDDPTWSSGYDWLHTQSIVSPARTWRRAPENDATGSPCARRSSRASRDVRRHGSEAPATIP